jgi:1-acyl-sn-glycerol-3-phosphate acyltransferase
VIMDQAASHKETSDRKDPPGRLLKAVLLVGVSASLTAVAVAMVGFFVFLASLDRKEPASLARADGIVALTGGANRIPDAVEWLSNDRGKRLLISGVGASTSLEKLVQQTPPLKPWLGCCIDLDHIARNTVGNALETRRWATAKGYRSLIVVTSSYHMPRAMLELQRHMPGMQLIAAPVVTERLQVMDFWQDPQLLRTVAQEYAKFLVAYARARLTSPSASDDITASAPRRRVCFTISNILWFVLALPTLLLPRPLFLKITLHGWCWTNLTLFNLICGVKSEIRGRENIPAGGFIVACKHQSAWETMALVTAFPAPRYILKRELMWIPFFGFYLKKADQIAINRGRKAEAIAAINAAAAAAIAEGGQVLIFPEGTRRPVDAPPDYKMGVAHLYDALKVPVLPVAINAGVCWPRRTFIKNPGTVVMEFLPVIQPGLPKAEFFNRLQETIETHSNRLVAEARGVAVPDVRRPAGSAD